MNKNKKLLVWAGVFNVIATIFFVYCVVMLINNVNGFADELKQSLLEFGYTNAEVAEALNGSVIEFITCAIVCGVCAISNFVFAYLKQYLFFKFKWFNVVLACVNGIIGMNVVSGLIVIYASFSRKQEVQVVMVDKNGKKHSVPAGQVALTADQIKGQLKLKGMAEKIEIVKHLKAEGSISEAEYIKLVDEIIANGVKE